MRKAGYELYFIGAYVKSFYLTNPFIESIPVKFSMQARAGLPFWWRNLVRKILRLVQRIKPDLIHAHNVIAGRLAVEIHQRMGIPFVYDDHEYWSRRTVSRNPPVLIRSVRVNDEVIECENLSTLYVAYNNLRHLIGKLIRGSTYEKWEREVLSLASTVLTVSEEIAGEHRLVNPNVKVLPNYPFKDEIVDVELKERLVERRLEVVYVGRILGFHPSYRDMRGMIETLSSLKHCSLVVVGDSKLRSTRNIISKGVKPHRELISTISRSHLGLLPWKPHSFHHYCNPNKVYEYAAAGLHIVIPKTLTPVRRVLEGFYDTFEDSEYRDLKALLSYYSDNLDEVIDRGLSLLEYARRKLVWDMYEHELIEMYDKVI